MGMRICCAAFGVQVELVQMQEESLRRAEVEKQQIAQQIEAERRATEKYKSQVCGQLGGKRVWVYVRVRSAVQGADGWPAGRKTGVGVAVVGLL